MTKPTIESRWKHATIFIYDRPDEYDATSHPVLNAVAINRRLYAGCRLLYTSLSMTGSCNKAGKASFTVVQMGDADVNKEVDLLQANKYVAIVAGTDLLWTGKILRAISSIQSNYSAASLPQTWKIECESDIGKMKLQKVKTPGIVTGTIGNILSTLLKNALSTDINWLGDVEPSIISNEGAQLSYNILDGDIYSQFISLMSVSGFEWRTRFQNHMSTGTWNGTDTFMISTGNFTPYLSDDFIGKWVLLFHDTLADTTSNSNGVIGFGYCSDNDDTTITLTNVKNASLVPTTNSAVKAMVLINPVVDATWDLAPPTPQQTFYCNRARDMSIHNCYEYNDKTDKKNLATKVTVKAKNVDVSLSPTGASNTISTTLTSINKWVPEDSMFENSTVVTHKMDGYVYSYTGGSTTLYLIGSGYALASGQILYCSGKKSAAGDVVIMIATISGAPTVETQADGTVTTKITLSAGGFKDTSESPPTTSYTVMKYAVVVSNRLYVADASRLYSSWTSEIVNIGGSNNVRWYSANGTDAVYGEYITIDPAVVPYFGPSFGDATPAFPGCLLTNNVETESSPNDLSPLKSHGLILATDTVDTAITKGELEMYATQALINHSFYLRKGGFSCLLTDFLKPGERSDFQLYDWQVLKEGDRVTTLPNDDATTTDVYPDGQYKHQWEIMSWTLDANTMKVTVELGDFEENIFMLMNYKTTALNQTIT